MLLVYCHAQRVIHHAYNLSNHIRAHISHLYDCTGATVPKNRIVAVPGGSIYRVTPVSKGGHVLCNSNLLLITENWLTTKVRRVGAFLVVFYEAQWLHALRQTLTNSFNCSVRYCVLLVA